jgi:hypothetical protein
MFTSLVLNVHWFGCLQVGSKHEVPEEPEAKAKVVATEPTPPPLSETRPITPPPPSEIEAISSALAAHALSDREEEEHIDEPALEEQLRADEPPEVSEPASPYLLNRGARLSERSRSTTDLQEQQQQEEEAPRQLEVPNLGDTGLTIEEINKAKQAWDEGQIVGLEDSSGGEQPDRDAAEVEEEAQAQAQAEVAPPQQVDLLKLLLKPKLEQKEPSPLEYASQKYAPRAPSPRANSIPAPVAAAAEPGPGPATLTRELLASMQASVTSSVTSSVIASLTPLVQELRQRDAMMQHQMQTLIAQQAEAYKALLEEERKIRAAAEKERQTKLLTTISSSIYHDLPLQIEKVRAPFHLKADELYNFRNTCPMGTPLRQWKSPSTCTNVIKLRHVGWTAT